MTQQTHLDAYRSLLRFGPPSAISITLQNMGFQRAGTCALRETDAGVLELSAIGPSADGGLGGYPADPALPVKLIVGAHGRGAVLTLRFPDFAAFVAAVQDDLS